MPAAAYWVPGQRSLFLMRANGGSRHLEPTQIPGSVPTGRQGVGGWYLAAGLVIVIGAMIANAAKPPPPVDRLTLHDFIEAASPANQQKLQRLTPIAVDEQELDQALATMRLNARELIIVRQALAAKPPVRRSRWDRNATEPTPGEVTSPLAPFRLVQFRLSDSHADDGDAVTLSTEHYSVDVPLARKPVTVTMLIDRNSTMTVTGLRDGGHGITATMQGEHETVRLPVMYAGRQQMIRLRN